MALMYYEPRHFLPQELVPPSTYADLKDQSLLVMDYRMLKTIDAIREFFNSPVWINTWLYNKRGRKYSGFRPRLCHVGAKYSQHRYGRACDMLIDGVTAKQAREAILENQNHFPYNTVIEDRVSWLHVDCRAITNKGVQLIQP